MLLLKENYESNNYLFDVLTLSFFLKPFTEVTVA